MVCESFRCSGRVGSWWCSCRDSERQAGNTDIDRLFCLLTMHHWHIHASSVRDSVTVQDVFRRKEGAREDGGG